MIASCQQLRCDYLLASGTGAQLPWTLSSALHLGGQGCELRPGRKGLRSAEACGLLACHLIRWLCKRERLQLSELAGIEGRLHLGGNEVEVTWTTWGGSEAGTQVIGRLGNSGQGIDSRV